MRWWKSHVTTLLHMLELTRDDLDGIMFRIHIASMRSPVAFSTSHFRVILKPCIRTSFHVLLVLSHRANFSRKMGSNGWEGSLGYLLRYKRGGLIVRR